MEKPEKLTAKEKLLALRQSTHGLFVGSTREIGWNYLGRHRELERQIDLDVNLVITKRHDWNQVVKFFNKYPELVDLIGEKD